VECLKVDRVMTSEYHRTDSVWIKQRQEQFFWGKADSWRGATRQMATRALGRAVKLMILGGQEPNFGSGAAYRAARILHRPLSDARLMKAMPALGQLDDWTTTQRLLILLR
jgi:hypothetical protein